MPGNRDSFRSITLSETLYPNRTYSYNIKGKDPKVLKLQGTPPIILIKPSPTRSMAEKRKITEMKEGQKGENINTRDPYHVPAQRNQVTKQIQHNPQ